MFRTMPENSQRIASTLAESVSTGDAVSITYLSDRSGNEITKEGTVAATSTPYQTVIAAKNKRHHAHNANTSGAVKSDPQIGHENHVGELVSFEVIEEESQ